jgi:Flp pilus assembly protein TadG
MNRMSGMIRSRIRRLARNERGVAAIEFGFVSSVLIVLMVMATDLGLAMQHRSQMEAAVRAGLQKALDDAATLDDVENAALASSDLPSSPAPSASAERQCFCPGGSEVSCTTGTCNNQPRQDYIVLTMEQDHQWLLGFPGISNPSPISMTHSLRVE